MGEFQVAQKSVNPLSYIHSFMWHSLHACISLLHSTKQLVLTLVYVIQAEAHYWVPASSTQSTAINSVMSQAAQLFSECNYCWVLCRSIPEVLHCYSNEYVKQSAWRCERHRDNIWYHSSNGSRWDISPIKKYWNL